MAWTSPRTWVTAETVTAAQFNEQIRDNESALSTHTHTGVAGDGAQAIGTTTYPLRPTTEGCRVYHSTTQTIGNTTVALNFDSERYDVGTLHDTSTNNTRITFAQAGVYMYGCTFTATGLYVGAYIRLNGSTNIEWIGKGVGHQYSCAGLYKFSAADYIEVIINNTGGLSYDFSAQEFFAQRIG
jgi:plastocyanin